MVLAFKLHLHTQIPSIQFTKLVRSSQTPLFQLQPIQACSLSPLQLNSRRPKPSPWGFNTSYSKLGLNVNIGGGGGGGIEDLKKYDGGDEGEGGNGIVGKALMIFFRVTKWLMGYPKGKSVEKVADFGFEWELALVFMCFMASCLLYVAMMEIGNAVMKLYDACCFLVYAVIDVLSFQFV